MGEGMHQLHVHGVSTLLSDKDRIAYICPQRNSSMSQEVAVQSLARGHFPLGLCVNVMTYT